MTDRGRKGPYERNDRRNATIKKYSEELKFSLNISNKDGRNVKTVTNFSDLFPWKNDSIEPQPPTPTKKKGIIRGDNLTFRESPCSFQNLALSKSEISVYKQRHFSFILMTISNISIVPHLNQWQEWVLYINSRSLVENGSYYR